MPLDDITRKALNRDNFRDLLAKETCPNCLRVGNFSTFDNPDNGAVGLVCICGQKHPLRPKVWWLPKPNAPKRRSECAESLRDVLERCGWRCWGCGTDYDTLRAFGIGFHRHHTKPHVEVKHDTDLVPLCSYCHQAINLIQRFMREVLKKQDSHDVA